MIKKLKKNDELFSKSMGIGRVKPPSTKKSSKLQKKKKDVETIEQIERRIDKTILDLKSAEEVTKMGKNQILFDLSNVWTRREELFLNHPEYKNDFVIYIEKRFLQNHKTTLDDVKIIELLEEHGQAAILKQNIGDMIYMLKSVAQLRHKKLIGTTPKALQSSLLGEMPNIKNRVDLRKKIKPYLPPKKNQKPTRSNFPNSSSVLEKDKKRLVFKSEDETVLNKVNAVVRGLNSENLELIEKLVQLSLRDLNTITKKLTTPQG